MAVSYTYDGKFEGNILIVGQTGCGKTKFIQNSAKNNLFYSLMKYFGYQKYRSEVKEEKTYLLVFKNT